MTLRVVVLPQPLGPMMLVSSPRGTSKESPPIACTSLPKSLTRSTTRTAASPVARTDGGVRGVGRGLGHEGLISGRNNRSSRRWSRVMLTLAKMMIDKIAANIRG